MVLYILFLLVFLGVYVLFINYLQVLDKLGPRSQKCVFLGYSRTQRGYRCYSPTLQFVRLARYKLIDSLKDMYLFVSLRIGNKE